MDLAKAFLRSMQVDAVVVGAGFAGLYMLYRLREIGLRTVVLERGDGVGGTWYWNRYPGARCDVESMQYSYQFSDALQQDWVWSERYAAQPEILRYANHVADRFDLRRDILFNRGVTSAVYDDEQGAWSIETDSGDCFVATFCIMATGCLSSTNKPAIDGLDRFQGDVFHTGLWPKHDVNFRGRRVAVIGTGSSAIQSIPVIAKDAAELIVFQRTPNYAVPANNRPLDPDDQRAVKADYATLRTRAKTTRNGIDFPIPTKSALEVSKQERAKIYEDRWALGGLSFISTFTDLLVNKEANDTAAAFIRSKIKDAVSDPKVAELLSPRSIVGCKRMCVDIGYFETYNRDNVTLVDTSKASIEEVLHDGIKANGRKFDVDMIVLATGFDAMTGALNRIDIRGRNDLALSSKWSEGPKSYLGLAMAGFPNFFTITGPGSPSVLTNMLPTIEQHVEWITGCISYLHSNGFVRIEATVEAEAAWVEHVSDVAGGLLYPQCNSWYLGANVAGKPRVFMPYPGFPPYVKKCNDVVEKGYEGFALL